MVYFFGQAICLSTPYLAAATDDQKLMVCDGSYVRRGCDISVESPWYLNDTAIEGVPLNS